MAQSQSSYIEKFIPVIQTWMNENIKDRASSSDIFTALGPAVLGDLSPTNFQVGLSAAVREGKITGFEGRRGRFGGYFPIGAGASPRKIESVEDETEEEETEEDTENVAGCVNISSVLRLKALDKRNWGLQRKSGESGENWANIAYYGNITEAFRGISSRLIDGHFRLSEKQIEGFNEVAKVLREVEASIKAALTALPMDG